MGLSIVPTPNSAIAQALAAPTSVAALIAKNRGLVPGNTDPLAQAVMAGGKAQPAPSDTGQADMPAPTVVQMPADGSLGAGSIGAVGSSGAPVNADFAKALQQRGMGGGAIVSPWDLAGRLAETGVGTWMQNKSLQQAKAEKDQQIAKLAAIGTATDPLQAMFASQDPDLIKAAATARLAAGKTTDKPPEVHEFFDDQGRQYYGQWNQTTKQWDKVGGSKADTATAAKAPEVQEFYDDKTHQPYKAQYVNGQWVQVGGTKADATKPPESKEVGGRIFERNAATGAWEDKSPPTIGPAPLFDTKSVEGQSLNYLIDNGALTKEEAANIGAGKTITGPQGEIIFMTPQGVYAKPAAGGEPKPFGPPTGAPPAATTSQATPGLIPLTGPKPGGLATDVQNQAATYADRLAHANETINQFESVGTDLPQSLANNVPVAGNYMVSPEYQQLDQAQRNFLNAVLRKESGAVINADEFENGKQQYFPQPGDGPEKLALKRQNRIDAINGMQRSAGPNYKPAAAAPTTASPTPTAAPAPTSAGPARVTNDDDYNRLPSGTLFVGPDGKTRKKP